MQESRFMGREKEYSQLKQLITKKSASLVVVKGRRRIGKSRLIEEFAKNQTTYAFTGLPPHIETTAQSQREVFALQLRSIFHYAINPNDWWDLLLFLAEKTSEGRVLIFFDEISWMGDQDPEFLGKVKSIWDMYFKKNPALILVLCGSVSTWIDENILSSTGFMGRISLQLHLKELSIKESYQLIDQTGFKGSDYEKALLMAVMGGIPRYLEEIKPKMGAVENIKNLAFEASGILFNEFDQIFTDIFEKRSEIYLKIIQALINGPKNFDEVTADLAIAKGGKLSLYLENLLGAGFVQRDFTWNLEGSPSKLSLYRLSDNYLRFYLKYILPNQAKIMSELVSDFSITQLPGWNATMGLQFQNLILNNRALIIKKLNIDPADILNEGPFFQRTTQRRKGCQIDYLIQTKTHTLLVCEIKWTTGEIKTSIIADMQDKLDRLVAPKKIVALPVLIHLGDVSDQVYDAHYFYRIISFSDLII